MREEFAALVSAFRQRLQWQLDHGTYGVSAAAMPRAPMPVEAPAAEAPAAEARGAEAARAKTLDEIRAGLGNCQRCRLGKQRTHLVFGEGSPHASLMFVGEAPGRDEDLQGRPFVGAAGQLLGKMIEAMGLSREDVYICNILKCRPPENRDPNPDEIEACEPVLAEQIAAIGPRMIIALGSFAAKTLLRTDAGISQLRGRFHTYRGTPLMPTFHPAYLLRNPERKRPVWEDLKQVMAEMDRLGLRRSR